VDRRIKLLWLARSYARGIMWKLMLVPRGVIVCSCGISWIVDLRRHCAPMSVLCVVAEDCDGGLC
jgi:hypothetical protein